MNCFVSFGRFVLVCPIDYRCLKLKGSQIIQLNTTLEPAKSNFCLLLRVRRSDGECDGTTAEWCPVAKWVIRRCDNNERYAVTLS